jgi:hypothetical protein
MNRRGSLSAAQTSGAKRDDENRSKVYECFRSTGRANAQKNSLSRRSPDNPSQPHWAWIDRPRERNGNAGYAYSPLQTGPEMAKNLLRQNM